jgi:hypothetical protein
MELKPFGATPSWLCTLSKKPTPVIVAVPRSDFSDCVSFTSAHAFNKARRTAFNLRRLARLALFATHPASVNSAICVAHDELDVGVVVGDLESERRTLTRNVLNSTPPNFASRGSLFPITRCR